MKKFEECVKPDTPRLAVMYQRDGGGIFQWGLVGAPPILSLVGAIAQVQVRLTLPAEEPAPCPQPALCIAWRDGYAAHDWWVHPDIPVDPLVGMLEVIKSTVVATHVARQAAAQQVQQGGILGPDGIPLRRGLT